MRINHLSANVRYIRHLAGLVVGLVAPYTDKIIKKESIASNRISNLEFTPVKKLLSEKGSGC